MNVTASNVSIIPATRRTVQNGGQLNQQTGVRVAAYCRVSTGDESQQTSYTTQKRYYSGMIQSKADGRFAGVYADKAISGTSRAHRDGFNRMIEDALSGKIDYIVTKSISRFARNTVDTLACVRQLREQHPPVGVYFEKENIDTLDAKGELILTILSALAQEESRSISDNIRWSFQKNFQNGQPQINLKRMIGYDKAADGAWVINPEQAETVLYIFTHFADGASASRIAAALNAQGRFTINGKQWKSDSVYRVLRNEKYVGDLEMQKFVTVSFLTHKTAKNKGEAPRYYVKDHHAGIIDRALWDTVQSMLQSLRRTDEAEREKPGVKCSPLTGMVCGGCGAPYVRMTYSGKASVPSGESGSDNEKKRTFQYPVWRCRGSIGKKGKGCQGALLQECAIMQSFMEMLYALKRDYEANGDKSRISVLFEAVYKKACAQESGNTYSAYHMEVLDMQIAALESAHRTRSEACEDAKRQRELFELHKEKEAFETPCGAAALRKSYDFFLRCLQELPEVNAAGERLIVNGLETDEALIMSRDEKTAPPSNKERDGISITVEQLGACPDYLHFEKSLYLTFIANAVVRGDSIDYTTTFGVKLTSTGVRRTLHSFLGFRRCDSDGSVELLDSAWKVNGKSAKPVKA